MGVGLVFLLAKSATEFNKMTELRAEMEVLLKDIRYEVQRKVDATSSSELNNNISFSPSCHFGDIDRGKTTSMPNCNECFALQDAKCGFGCVRESTCASGSTDRRSLSMHQMEAELAVELERLQHNLDREGSSVLQLRMEVYFIQWL